MMTVRSIGVLTCFCLLFSALSTAQSYAPGFAPGLHVPGATLGVPTAAGGLTFSEDGSTLYMAGNANSPSGAIYALAVIRDPVTRVITGFGPPSYFAAAPDNDGGLAFGPRGTLFYTTYPSNSLGQIVGASTTVLPLPFDSASTGGLVWVPGGTANPDSFYVSSYTNGSIWSVQVTDNFDGTYTPTTATLLLATGLQLEGMAYVPSGPYSGRLIVSNYFNSEIFIVDPLAPANQLTIATGLNTPQGFAFDPITKSLFVSSFNTGDIDEITGFSTAAFRLSASSPTASVNGDQVIMTLEANVGFLSFYGILPSLTGSTPGTYLGGTLMQLNFDVLTEIALPMLNSNVIFSNFIGTMNPSGTATAYFNLPPVPAFLAGKVITFDAIELDGLSIAASNAVDVLLVP